MLPERAVDTAPRGRVSGVFGCEEDSFELGNIGAASSPDVGGRRPRPRPASRSAGQWARGAGTRTGTEPEESRARSRLPPARSVPSALGSVSSSAPPSLAGRSSPRFPGMVLSAFTVLQIKYKAGCVARWQLAE